MALRFDSRPRSLIEPFLFLYITERCQLSCKHCYMGERLERKWYMDKDLIKDILRFLKIAYGQYKVYLLGGEPTLHPEFNEILKICKQENYKVILTSNGLIPEKFWNDLIVDSIDTFSFSMDGATKETHEFMRGKGTFQKLLESLKKAIKTGTRTRIIFTVTEKNIREAEKVLDLAQELKIDMVCFHYFTPTGRGLKYPEIQVNSDSWMNFCSWVRKQPQKRKINIYYPPAFVKKNELDMVLAQGYRGCTARNLERLAIFPDRRVYTCSAFLDTDFHFGTFKEKHIIPIHNNKIDNELTLVNKISKNCFDCKSAPFCGGGCAAYNFFDKTLSSDRCTQEIVPICPLWSMPADLKINNMETISEFR